MPEPNSSDIVSASSQYPAEVNPTAQGSLTVLESLALPDSTSYQFCYDPTYATVDKISFPTGGYVRFVYGIRNSGSYNLYTPNGISSVVVTDVYRSTGSDTSCPSTPSASEDHWHYSYQNLTSGSNSGQLQSSVTDPMGNTTTYAASPYSYTIFTGAEPTWQETYRQISNGTTPVRTIYTTYGSTGGSTALPATITTTYNDASPVVQQQTRYAYDQYNNVVEKDESDGYPCSSGVCSPPGWLRKTLTTYYWAINSGYQTAHIVDKPYTETVTDGSGNPYAETIFGYDAYALSGSSGYANHDDQNYPATKLGPRGNLTSEARCVAFLGGTCSSWITTIHHYDLAGQLVSTTDPAGNTTSYNYTDQYVDGSPSAPTDGYVTTVTYPQTNAISHSDQFTYHFYSGKEASHTDWNNQVTSFLYTDPSSGAADPLNRLRQITLPKTVDGSTGQTTLGWTRYTYSDVPGSWSVETQRLMSSSGTATSTTANYDGLGRLSNTITADSLGNDEIDRTYDGDGRLFTITNPYRNTSDLSYGVTTYTYDALGRMLSLKDPDSTSNSTYKQTWSYSGLTVLFTDESGNQWQRTSDALGRLTKVQEPNGTSPAASLTTNYGYDLLDDLISVNQAGDGSSPARNRSFTYDGLGRLRSATNPESGMTTYHYSSLSGPLCSGDTSSVCSKTDARGVTTNFSYDALNRVSSKSYNDGATPWVCYLFDTAANGNGRLAYDWTQKASTGGCSSTFPAGNGYLTARSISAYDAMGRLQSEQQYTPASVAKSTSYLMIYTYDLAGNLTSSTTGASPPVTTFSSTPSAPCQNAPSFSTTMLTFVNCYDGTGRLLGVTSNAPTGPTSLFAAQGYSAFGGLTTATYGGSGSGSNAVTLTRTYDKRLRIASETDLGNSPAASTNGSATVTITGAEQNQ
jgi:YD repeat-containing protein